MTTQAPTPAERAFTALVSLRNTADLRLRAIVRGLIRSDLRVLRSGRSA